MIEEEHFINELEERHISLLERYASSRLGEVDPTIRAFLSFCEDLTKVGRTNGYEQPSARVELRQSTWQQRIVVVQASRSMLRSTYEPPVETLADLADQSKIVPEVFIGSSTEGLEIARFMQENLHEFSTVIWDQSEVFGLGTSTLEDLVAAVQKFDFGVFIFTPNDSVLSRGHSAMQPRDNVIFELGLFVGKLSRQRAFVVNPGGGVTKLPSDLSGIGTATYKPGETKYVSVVGTGLQQNTSRYQESV